MAGYYVWHAAVGGGTGADWTNAYTTLSVAVTGKAAGDIFYVAHDHAEVGAVAASMTITSPGTEVNAIKIFCVDRAGSVPPVGADLRTTATITTQTTGSITITNSIAECYGITFQCGTGANTSNFTTPSTASRSCRYVNCKFSLVNTSASSRITIGAAGAFSVLENCTMQFGATGQYLIPVGRIYWRGGGVVGSTFPTMLTVPAGSPVQFLVEGVDLSGLASGTSLVTASAATVSNIIFKDCKLGSTVIPHFSTSAGAGGIQTTVIRSDSGDTNYRTEHYYFRGSQVVETTIVRTGGASDGVTPIAWKIVTSTVTNGVQPFECLPITVWNETVGSAITVTIEGIWDTGTVPTNADIWIDVEYLGTSGFPLGGRATSGMASQLETAANIPAGSGTWGGSTTKFAMSATITPQEKGPITVYVKATKSASTFYIDPKPVLT